MSGSGYSIDGIFYDVKGTGDPVLLIPGWAGSTEDLTVIEEALARHYRVIAVDPPGSGRSQPQPRTYTSSYLTEDAKTFLTLLDEMNAVPAHVVGYSDGGEYALLMAEIDPQAVRSLVAWGAAGRIVLSDDFLSAWADVVDSPVPALQEFSDYLKDVYGAEHARLMLGSHARALRTIVEADGDVSRGNAGAVQCPALLITGEQDLFFAPPDIVSDLARAMPRTDFIEVAGVGHAVHRERPQWLAETITAWLARH